MIDDYKHLNKDSKFEVDIEDIAYQIVRMNYGVHRLLSALVRNIKDHRRDHNELAYEIEALLNKGLS